MPDASCSTPLDVLRTYWGYDAFRPMQAEIIESVMDGCDTLGLLPTGGGKSITFQVPAMLLPGLTVVVTPLISLMKDQVDNLRERGIRAAAVHSGLSRSEHKLAMDRSRLGKVKILYLSPEKLQSKAFVEELSHMAVSLIVVDEAHCISQWGYDFRPSYLRIAEFRRRFPSVAVLALTASATPEVTEDIMGRLEFRTRKVFARSFARPNISYLVRYADHKPQMLHRILSATSGSSIVYVRSRKRTREIAAELTDAGISADYYHAGLLPEEKNQKQNSWKAGEVRVMVATNAFGMGIDKPDVRVVVHIDLPSSLEEYYQEAGRAGRDGLPCYAVVIASKADRGLLTRRLNESFPDKSTICRVYEMAGNFLNVAVGSGYNLISEFNFPLFCERFDFKESVARNSLRLLTNAGYIEYVDEVTTRSRVMMTMDKRELYDLVLDRQTDEVLQLLLRTYTGLFADFVHISEELLASRLNCKPEDIYTAMLKLSREHVLTYVPRKTTPYLIYTTSRELPKHVVLPKAVYEDMRRRMADRIEAMKRFVFSADGCRVKGMLAYFGDVDAPECGTCDWCRAHKKMAADKAAKEAAVREAVDDLARRPGGSTIEYIAAQLGVGQAVVIAVVRELVDEGGVRLEGHTVSVVDE